MLGKGRTGCGRTYTTVKGSYVIKESTCGLIDYNDKKSSMEYQA